MKKIKNVFTYLIAIFCIGFYIFNQPEVTVFEPKEKNESYVMIYMMDQDDELVPVTLSCDLSDQQEENIKNVLQLMKQRLTTIHFEPLISKSIQILDVNIDNNLVKLNLNEAFYTMNSSNELKFIEGIVGAIVQLNPKYQVEFYVNDEKVEQMPLSGLVMKPFDSSLGINNFELQNNNLHTTSSKYVVYKKQVDDIEYFMIAMRRIPQNTSTLMFINNILNETNLKLKCEKIETKNNQMILHLNQAFLIDEQTIDYAQIECLLYSLHFNQYADEFVFKVNDEIVNVNNHQELSFHEITLNLFEE